MNGESLPFRLSFVIGIAVATVSMLAFWYLLPGGLSEKDPMVESGEFLLLAAAMVVWLILAGRQVLVSRKTAGHSSLIPVFLASVAAFLLQTEMWEWSEQDRIRWLELTILATILLVWIVLVRAWFDEGASKWDIVAEAFSAPMFPYLAIGAAMFGLAFAISLLLVDGFHRLKETLEILALLSFVFSAMVAHLTWFD